MRKTVLAALLVASVLVWALWWAEDAPTGDVVGIYALDQEAYARALARRWKVVLDEQQRPGSAVPVDPASSVFPERMQLAARATHVRLDLRSDGTFLLEGRTTQGLSTGVWSRVSGSWTRKRGVVVLSSSDPSLEDGPGWERYEVHGVDAGPGPGPLTIGEGSLTLPAWGWGRGVDHVLRRLPADEAALVRATPSERGRMVRGRMAPPQATGAFTFDGERLDSDTGFVTEGEPFLLSVEPASHEGAPAWKVTMRVREDGGASEHEETAWLAADLGLLRLRYERRKPSEGRHTSDVVQSRIVERTASGYRVESTTGGVAAEPVAIDAVESPLGTLAALLLFVRACPDLSLDYEVPVFERDQIDSRTVAVLGWGPALPMRQRPSAGELRTRATTLGWTVRSGNLALALAVEDRRPITLLTGGPYGASLIVERGLFTVYDVLGLTVPPQSAADAASVFLLAVVRGDRTVLEQLLDFGALQQQVTALGLPPSNGNFNDELLAKLERRRRSLLPKERELLAGAAGSVKRVTPEGAGHRVELHAPCEDFEVVVAPAEAGWRVTALLPTIYDETLCCGDVWEETQDPEPVYKGCRLWMYRRLLRSPYEAAARDAVHSLAAMGDIGHEVLLQEVRRALGEADVEAVEGFVAEAVSTGGPAVLPILVDAYREADEEFRRRLDGLGRRCSVYARPHGRSGGSATLELPFLLDALDLDWPAIWPPVLECLRSMGPAAADAIPHLQRLREKADGRLRRRIDVVLEALLKREIHVPLRKPAAGSMDSAYVDPSSWRLELHPTGAEAKVPISLRARRGEGDTIRFVGSFESGTYVIVLRSPRAGVILRDVELTERTVTLEPILATAGSTVVLNLEPTAGLDLRLTSATASRQGHPSFSRSAWRDNRTPQRLYLYGLAQGTYRVCVRHPGAPEPLLDQVVEVDGTTDLEIDV